MSWEGGAGVPLHRNSSVRETRGRKTTKRETFGVQIRSSGGDQEDGEHSDYPLKWGFNRENWRRNLKSNIQWFTVFSPESKQTGPDLRQDKVSGLHGRLLCVIWFQVSNQDLWVIPVTNKSLLKTESQVKTNQCTNMFCSGWKSQTSLLTSSCSTPSRPTSQDRVASQNQPDPSGKFVLQNSNLATQLQPADFN